MWLIIISIILLLGAGWLVVLRFRGPAALLFVLGMLLLSMAMLGCWLMKEMWDWFKHGR